MSSRTSCSRGRGAPGISSAAALRSYSIHTSIARTSSWWREKSDSASLAPLAASDGAYHYELIEQPHTRHRHHQLVTERKSDVHAYPDSFELAREADHADIATRVHHP